MMSYVLKGGLLAYSYISSLKSFTMTTSTDPFASLLTPTLRNDTGSFVENFFRLALYGTNQPLLALRSRFVVVLVGVNKAGTTFRHESFSVWAYDNVEHKDLLFVIERTPSNRKRAANFVLFSRCPGSEAVLKSIQDALQRIGSLTTKATTDALQTLPAMMLPTEDEDEDEDESIPLLPTTNESVTESQSSNAADTSSTYHSQKSLADVIGLYLIRMAAMARVASQSTSPPTLAADTISRMDKLNPNDCIRTFRPQNLPLFDLVLLADEIHEHAPLYSLFENQCYWFANLLFELIVQYYTLPASASVASTSSIPSGPLPAPTPEIGTPANANTIILPAGTWSRQAGRWMGVLINDPVVRLTVMSIVRDNFLARYERYNDQVILSLILSYCHLPNPQKLNQANA